ncbi:MAG: von Willebrand factor type A domain-containing protein [Chthoniobacterales bacterium]
MNDPRITAYALGELSDSERELFERELAASPDLQTALNETIQLAEVLGKLPMSTHTLPEKSKKELLAACAENQKNQQGSEKRKSAIRFLRSALIGGGLAAAAAIVLSFSVFDRELYKQTPSHIPKEQVTEIKSDQLAPPTSNTDFKDKDKLGQRLRRDVEVVSTSATASAAMEQKPAEVISEVQAQPPLTPQSVDKVKQVPGAFGKDFANSSGATARTLSRDFYLLENESIVRASNNFNTEAYDSITENVFKTAKDNPLSTFSIDVDTASYANVRRFLQNGQIPPAGAIRTEEFINYFTYDYPQPKAGPGEAPFSVSLELSQAPWAKERELVQIGIQGLKIPTDKLAPSNLVFLLDVSGSMNSPDKLPLLKNSLKALVNNLNGRDRVAIVVYAGASGLVLPSTSGEQKQSILEALDKLEAGGSTNGASGIQLAYQTAREHFLKDGNNRVILATDGDFNVGTTNQSELVKLIEKERADGIFLSVLGFGTGNLKDSTMEKLADKGNGNYAYIDSPGEARKVLVEQMGATLFTIAKDVKIQVEFNPAQVAAYRLIGYENRLLAKEDFNDDTKDAGEIGAGHSVTALYEIIPVGAKIPGATSVDPLKYQTPAATEKSASTSSELLTVKLRYKAPDGDTSKLLEFPLAAEPVSEFTKASENLQFASAVAAFGMKLRNSPFSGNISWGEIQKIARHNLGKDPGSYRAEFLTLVEKASHLAPQETSIREDD